MTQDNKRTFKAEIDGATVEVAIVRPNAAVSNAAHMHYQKAWSDALKRGCLLLKKLDDYVTEQGLWDAKKQEKYEELIRQIREGEEALKTGKIKLKEGYDIAVRQMRRARVEMQILMAERNQLEQNSAEGIAEQQRFNFLVSKCVLNNETGEPLFKNVDDYIEKSAEPWAFQAAAVFSQLNNGLDADFLASLPENQFLKTWGFVDENYRLVNEDGKLVDEEGKLINELGQWINSEGELVDSEGKPIDEDGNLKVEEEAVFYDDDGNPMTPPKPKTKKEKVDKTEETEVESTDAESPSNLPKDELEEDSEVVELQKS